MKPTPQNPAPQDAEARKAIKPIVCYPIDSLPAYDETLFVDARNSMELVDKIIVAPRDAETFSIPAGHFFRITCPEGPQVGDLNLWNEDDLSERFFSGKTRALHGTHVSAGDRLWSNLPHMRPMATITHDTLDWYGWDAISTTLFSSRLIRALCQHRIFSLVPLVTICLSFFSHPYFIKTVFYCLKFYNDSSILF